ncbi:MAG: tetratricopeptide repeat protein [Bacteroidetes bacterium]|nr:tetratricopeptide repeat protein [Bacteroidota bacterium]
MRFLICLLILSGKLFAQDGNLNEAKMEITPETLRKHGTVTYMESPKGALPNTVAAGGSYLAHYRMARELQDWPAASQALIAYLTAQPMALPYQDTLLEVYTLGGQWNSAALLARRILMQQPLNQYALEKLAFAYENLQLTVPALAAYKRLYEQSFRPSHLYYVANLQYRLQQADSSLISLNEVLQHPATARTTLSLSVSAQQVEEIPLAAAAHNLRGYIWQQQGKTADARKAYEEALRLAPHFSLAQGNLSLLKK